MGLPSRRGAPLPGKMFDVAHRDTHPEYVDGCFGCKVMTVGVSAGALEVRGAAVRAMDAKDKALDGDLAAYKRLRNNGLQPKAIDGSLDVERKVTSQFDIDLGHVVPKKDVPRVREGFALAREMGMG